MSYAMSIRELDQLEIRARTRLDNVMERVGIQLIGERANGDQGTERRQPEQTGEADGGITGSTDGGEPRYQSPPDPSRPEPQRTEEPIA